mmetsp:Transcript_31406/g.27750  ORF Transcript_31406/g.27750 Transcript_31406/m.27750 type:complete len:217 (-) Transcript_31406:33-683(-)
MLTKLYLKSPSFYSNQLLFLSNRNFAHVVRPVPGNNHSYIEKIKNKKRARFGQVKRFYDFHGNTDRAPPTGIYRGGLIETDFTGLDDRVRQAFSLNNGSLREIKQARLEAFKHRFGNGIHDTGSAAMQAATFCERTLNCVRHMQTNRGDAKATIRLCDLLVQRRKALVYLKRKDFQKYTEMVHYYKVKDAVVGLHKSHFHLKNIHRRNSGINPAEF